MAEQLRVFVSHSHEDYKFCRKIVQALRDANADVWYDEHNLTWGELHEVIQRELGRRAIFVLILSKAAFASKWVKRETLWAYRLYDRYPTRAILPATAGQIDPNDFDPEKGWLFLDDFKRIEAPGYKPYPVAEAAHRLVRALGLTPLGEAPAPAAPQPNEDMNDLLTRGKALIAQKQYGAAQPFFERATELAPRSVAAWTGLGYTYYKHEHYREALDTFDKALSLNPCDAMAWVGKGAVLGSLRRDRAALEAFDKALALDPHHRNAWYDKAIVLRRLGRTTEAEAAEQRARKLGGKK